MGTDILGKAVIVLKSYPMIRLAWVYGSFAKGNPSNTSDLDIGVAADKYLTNEEKIAIAQRIAAATGREVDLVDVTAERGIIASQILTTGRLLVNESRELLASLIKRMWFDRADFWPHRERIYSARRKKAFDGGAK